MGEFRMPALGADMDEGKLVEWLVEPGAVVHRGDILAVIDTAKTAMEIEAFEDGVVERLLVEPGRTVPVGTTLAVIATGEVAPAVAAAEVATPALVGTGAAPPAGPAVASPLVRHLAHLRHLELDRLHGTGEGGVITRADVEQAAAAAPRTPAPAATGAAPTRPAAVGGRVAASPFARRRAAELQVDLADLRGSGPGGAITVADVEVAATGRRVASSAAPPTTPRPPVVRAGAVSEAKPEVDRALAMRRAIGNLMARSKKEIPHYYLTATIDVSRATAWLRERNATRSVSDRLVPAALLLKAAALAAGRVPEMNGFWIDDGFVPGDGVHLGVAIALRQGGLIAPAIHDADTLELETLMGRLRDLVSRARAGRLRQSEMSDPTITVTNLGDLGVDSVHGVIYAPQVALVGFGRVAPRPWAQDGMLAVRDVVVATLAADHRASDGHRGGRYLSLVDELLQKPEEL